MSSELNDSKTNLDIKHIKLIVGLGNPGSRYVWTPHNAGFILSDLLVSRYDLSLRKKWVSESEAFFGDIESKEAYVLKPLTFMNLSGQAVQPSLSKLSCKPEEILVIHDEVDLDWGRIKLKFSGGTAGHNGLRSIVSKIGKDFWRLRVGVGRDPVIPTVNHVLRSKPSADFEFLASAGLDAISDIFTKGPKLAMNRINSSE